MGERHPTTHTCDVVYFLFKYFQKNFFFLFGKSMDMYKPFRPLGNFLSLLLIRRMAGAII